jgi:CubicO group peptidase (beta-lactamase class C family)
MTRHRIPGVALAIARNGQRMLGRGLGWRDMESRLAVTPNTVFPVASVTKSFTALAIMQLQDARRLSVADPVVKYLPEFRTPDAAATSRLTIHHLLTHTSGLPLLPARWFAFARDAARDFDSGDIPVRLDSRPPIDTPEQFMEFLSGIAWTPLAPPGSFFSYSNEGYVLLGTIVERVSGVPYDRYVRQHILEPLDLRQTVFDVEMPDEHLEAAVTYVPKLVRGAKTVVPLPRWWASKVWLPSGGICSSVGDLIRYLNVYRAGVTGRGERIVSQAALKEMLRPQVLVSPRSAYGYGFLITDYDGETITGHLGGRVGASAHVLFLPQRGLNIAALANMECDYGAVPWSATLYALNLLLGLPVDSQPSPHALHPLPKARLRTYAGEYDCSGEDGSGDRRITVGVHRRGLALEIDGSTHIARPAGKDGFILRRHEREEYMKFHMNGDGRPWGLQFGLAIYPRAQGPARRARRSVRSVLRGIVRRVRRYRVA